MKTFQSFFCSALFGLIAAAAAEPTATETGFAGKWLGRVRAPNGDTAEVGFAFVPTARGLRVEFTMPDMNIAAANFGPAMIKDDVFTLPPLDTTLTLRGEKLVGTFAIPGLPVELVRVGALPDAPPMPPVRQGPSAMWQAKLDGNVWGSPVVRDHVAYVGTASGRVYARSVADGREVWTWSGPTPLYGTALVTDSHVLFVDAAGDVVALNRTDGKLVWRRPLVEPRPETFEDETFTHRTPTPVLLDDTVIVGSRSGRLVGLEHKSGDVRWSVETGTRIYATIGVDRDALYVGGFDGTLLKLDRTTRRELARAKLPRAIMPQPIIAGDTVLVGGRDYLLYGFDRADLKERWRYSYWFSWVESTPSVVDGVAYLGGSDYARIVALEPATGHPRWLAKVYGITWGTPVVTPDTIYAGTQAQANAIIPHRAGIVAVERSTGATKWRIDLPLGAGANRAGAIGSLALDEGRLLAALFDGTLMAFDLRGR